MIVDASAIVAILFDEPERSAFIAAMGAAQHVGMAATTWVEASMVVDRHGDGSAAALFKELMESLDIKVIAFTAAHGVAARAAFNAYGRGSGHPAKLNYGDCMAYAVATFEGEPLLFKGEDFAATNIVPALGN